MSRISGPWVSLNQAERNLRRAQSLWSVVLDENWNKILSISIHAADLSARIEIGAHDWAQSIVSGVRDVDVEPDCTNLIRYVQVGEICHLVDHIK